MRKLNYLIIGCMAVVAMAFSVMPSTTSLKYDLSTGSPEIKSMSKLSFGPDGILFIGDTKSASVFALNTNDTKANQQASDVSVKDIAKTLAESLGTTAEDIVIQDMVANPISKALYFAVHTADGTPVLLKMVNGKISKIGLDNVEYSMAGIVDAPAEDAADSRGRPIRVHAISDLEYADGKVMVSGLSNKEFSSTFRSMSFPFKDDASSTSLEIYHANHGRYETYAPIKSFTTAEIGGRSYLVASYTCTPLVLFPMDELKSGQHVKGRTVGELGNRNTPLDIISMKLGNKTSLLFANSSRPMMRVNIDDINRYDGSLTSKVEETGGVDFKVFDQKDVQQLDAFGNNKVVMIQKMEDGALALFSAPANKWQ
ncbi:MAG: hypothetical protein ACFHWX_06815 [Bacteroidota bacterium]